jgi:hypothetical protein
VRVRRRCFEVAAAVVLEEATAGFVQSTFGVLELLQHAERRLMLLLLQISAHHCED